MEYYVKLFAAVDPSLALFDPTKQLAVNQARQVENTNKSSRMRCGFHDVLLCSKIMQGKSAIVERRVLQPAI